jgi:hypothetical protein
MNWTSLFIALNVIAFAGWAMLAFLPRRPIVMAIILFFGVGLLCLAYGIMFAFHVRGILAGDFLSIDGIRALFASDAGIVIGWTHYLAFDLFVGQWIARDADNKGFHRLVQLPFLFVTLLAGPIGLLLWLLARERRARAVARGGA